MPTPHVALAHGNLSSRDGDVNYSARGVSYSAFQGSSRNLEPAFHWRGMGQSLHGPMAAELSLLTLAMSFHTENGVGGHMVVAFSLGGVNRCLC